MGELKFIKGFGQSECNLIQQGNKYIVEDRFIHGDRKEFSEDNLLGAIVYAQENFALVKFPVPMTFKESVEA